MKTTAYVIRAAVVLVLIAPSVAQGAVIRESAALGRTGQFSPFVVIGENSGVQQYLGFRFTLANVVQVESVGGHLVGSGSGPSQLFAAIVSLSSPTALPSGDPFDAPPLATTVFTPPTPSDDILVPLPVTLSPGAYALVFGSGLFGATGYGGMPFNNIPIVGSESYLDWHTNSRWRAGPFNEPLRFVVTGTVVPEPGACLLAAIALLALRRHYVSASA